jgi:hypothetical protein
VSPSAATTAAVLVRFIDSTLRELPTRARRRARGG